ncbi:MAG TPA: helix-turn-helix transcriptional regulator [Afipia sp.]
MARAPLHPTRDQIELPMLLDCLSDPTRLAIVYNLANHENRESELRCGDFSSFGAKSNLAYHFARLREAGLVHTRVEGTARYMRLRRKDLEARFPGLLDSLLSAVKRDADRLELPQCEFVAVEAAEDEAHRRVARVR